MKPSRKQVHPKVIAGGIAGAATILIVGILDRVGVSVSVVEAQALTVLLSAAAGYAKAAH
jgi:hypothetical protein